MGGEGREEAERTKLLEDKMKKIAEALGEEEGTSGTPPTLM